MSLSPSALEFAERPLENGADGPGHLVPVCGALEHFGREAGCADGVALSSFDAGSTLVVTTRNSCYRLELVDPDNRRVLVEGGKLFPEPTAARLEGSTAGGSIVKTGWIGVGLRLELWVGIRRIVTSPVRAISYQPSAISHQLSAFSYQPAERPTLIAES
jgi:hypothetical protein